MVRLRRSNVNGPGIRRRKCGKGFSYVGPDGARITDASILQRIRSLAIPPAWTNVWISPLPIGHIQAIGTDGRGRRQYRYHDLWRVRRDAEKFEHMVAFAAALEPLRQSVAEHLAGPELSRERVLAVAVRLLDVGFFRIGTEGYAEENNTFGLATLRKDHVQIRGHQLTFDYIAKSGKRRVQSVVDADVADTISRLKRRRGGPPELLAYRHGGRWVDVKSSDINAYLKEQTGGDVTAKDFRTWHATVLCAVSLARVSGPATDTGRKRAVAAAVKEVSEYLGNTPAVCRNSYVDPRVIDRYHAGATIADAVLAADRNTNININTSININTNDLPNANAAPGGALPQTQRALIEAAVLDLISDAAAALAA